MRPFWIAFSTLTLLPVSVRDPSSMELRRSVIFYPLVGGSLGTLFFLLHLFSLPKDILAQVILVTWVIMTGAFHLDGLGDCLDGWFGGKNIKDRLRIMKAADLGTYGMTGIILVILSKYVLLAYLLGEGGPEFLGGKDPAIFWLLVTPAVARWGVCLACRWAKAPTGNQGLGSQVLGLSDAGFVLATLLTIVFGMPLKWPFLTAFGVTAGISFGTTLMSRSKIGGLTGDGLGAIIELSEVAILFVGCLSYA